MNMLRLGKRSPWDPTSTSAGRARSAAPQSRWRRGEGRAGGAASCCAQRSSVRLRSAAQRGAVSAGMIGLTAVSLLKIDPGK